MSSLLGRSEKIHVVEKKSFDRPEEFERPQKHQAVNRYGNGCVSIIILAYIFLDFARTDLAAL